MATMAEESEFQDWQSKSENRPITFVVVGRSGAGKSTLTNTLLDLIAEKQAKGDYTGESVTKKVRKFTARRHGVDIHIIDTPGMQAVDRTEEDEQAMIAELHEITNGKADAILYCKSCLPSSPIDNLDIQILKSLTKVFGHKIWMKTIFIITFANFAATFGGDVKQLTLNNAKHFNIALEKAGISSVRAKSVMEIEQNEQFNGIFAVPVAKSVEEKLPHSDNWVAYLYTIVLKKCDPDAVPQLLQLRGLLNPLWKVAAGTGAGAATGAGVGALGVGVGALPGAIIGGVFGGVAAGAWTVKEMIEIYRTNKKVQEIIKKKEIDKDYKDKLSKD